MKKNQTFKKETETLEVFENSRGSIAKLPDGRWAVSVIVPKVEKNRTPLLVLLLIRDYRIHQQKIQSAVKFQQSKNHSRLTAIYFKGDEK